MDAHKAYDRLLAECGLTNPTNTDTTWVTYRLMGVWSDLGPLVDARIRD